MTATDLAEFLRNALECADRAYGMPDAGAPYAYSYITSAVRQAIHTLNNRAQVERAEAERAANELVGPVLSGPAQRAYPTPTRRQLEDAWQEACERADLGVSLSAACEDVCASIGLTPDEFDEFVVEHLTSERAIAAEETR